MSDYQTGKKVGRSTFTQVAHSKAVREATYLSGAAAGFVSAAVEATPPRAKRRITGGAIILAILLVAWLAPTDPTAPPSGALMVAPMGALGADTKALPPIPTAVPIKDATFYDMTGPECPYREVFIQEGRRVDFPWRVLAEVARNESVFNPKATNRSDGGRGIGQFMPATWAETTASQGWTWDDAYDAEKNIWAMATYFDWIRGVVTKPGMTEREIVLRCVTAYNWGASRVNTSGPDAAPALTRAYANRILKASGY